MIDSSNILMLFMILSSFFRRNKSFSNDQMLRIIRSNDLNKRILSCIKTQVSYHSIYIIQPEISGQCSSQYRRQSHLQSHCLLQNLVDHCFLHLCQKQTPICHLSNKYCSKRHSLYRPFSGFLDPLARDLNDLLICKSLLHNLLSSYEVPSLTWR